MQFLVLVINIVLNSVLLFIASRAVLTHDDQNAVDTWTKCAWCSAALVIANLVFCIARMLLLWRLGQHERSLWGLVVLVILTIGAYYLLGAY